MSIIIVTWSCLFAGVEAVISSAPLGWWWNFKAHWRFSHIQLNLVLLFFFELCIASCEAMSLCTKWQPLTVGHIACENQGPSSPMFENPSLRCEKLCSLFCLKYGVACHVAGIFKFMVTFHLNALTVWPVFPKSLESGDNTLCRFMVISDWVWCYTG